MTSLFLKIVNMSISASWVVLAVLIFRMILKKAPKWINLLLWGVAAVRLICPISVESALSLLPSAETIPEKVLLGRSFSIRTGIPSFDYQVNEYVEDHYYEGITVVKGAGYSVMNILAMIWLAGIFCMICYTMVSYLRLWRRVNMAVLLRDNIYQSEYISSPFVLGIVHPRIYIPFRMKDGNLRYVIAHEWAHIERKDHWWKLLGFALLVLHWFNPLMWLSYALVCKDIEKACDEKVIRKLEDAQRTDYSQTLLSCSAERKLFPVCPLAFGEVSVKERVHSVLHYKKPAFWIVAVSVLICIAAAICFLTNPKTGDEKAVAEMKGIQLGAEDSSTSEENGSEAVLIAAFIKNFTGERIDIDVVEYVTDDDVERKAELIEDLKLSEGNDLVDGNFLNGYYIYNPEEEYVTYPIADDARFYFIDWGRDFTEDDVMIPVIHTTDNEVFKKYLDTYENAQPHEMPFYAAIENGEITMIEEPSPDRTETLVYIKGFDGSVLSYDQVEWVSVPSDRAAELNITEDDGPSGFVVYNAHVTGEELSLSEDCVLRILDWTSNFEEKEVTVEELAKVWKERGEMMAFIPYHLVIEKNEITAIFEQYVP